MYRSEITVSKVTETKKQKLWKNINKRRKKKTKETMVFDTILDFFVNNKNEREQEMKRLQTHN